MEEPNRRSDWLRREQATVWLIVSDFFGIFVMVTFLVRQIPLVSTFNSGFALFPFPDDWFGAVGFFLFPIGYCAIASLLFNPKRIVSPLIIQVGTVIVSAFLAVDIAYRAQTIQVNPNLGISQLFSITNFYIAYVIGSVVMSMLIFGVIGFLQTLAVRWIVALNEGEVDRATYSTNSNASSIIKRLNEDKSVLLRDFKEIEDGENMHVFSTDFSSGERIVIAVMPDAEGKTRLATVALEKGLYGISKSAWASATRDSVIKDLVGDDKILLQKTDDAASLRAYSVALAPTVSKVQSTRLFFRGLQTHFKVAIGTTIALFVAITLAASAHLAAFDYVSAAVLILVALGVELSVAIGQERSRLQGSRKS